MWEVPNKTLLIKLFSVMFIISKKSQNGAAVMLNYVKRHAAISKSKKSDDTITILANTVY